MAVQIAGVDISYCQPKVDYAKLSKAITCGKKVEFAILRCAYSTYEDIYFKKHVDGCLANGLKIGMYVYSNAMNVATAKAEAKYALSLIKKYNLDGKVEYPILFDIEATKQFNLGKVAVTNIIRAFCDTIEAGGYQSGLYTYATFYNGAVNKTAVKDIPLWISGFVYENTLRNKFGIKEYMAWQYSVAGHPSYDVANIGSVAGVPGQCDCDFDYVNFPELIKAAGKNGFNKKPIDLTDIGKTVKSAGIDLCAYQSGVNYTTLANGSIKGHKTSFAMVRCSTNKTEDTKFKAHVDNLIKTGVNVGLYHTSSAKTVAEAKAQAEYVIGLIKKYNYDGKIKYPIAFALSNGTIKSLGQVAATNVIKAFCDTIKSYNYMPIIETTLDMIFTGSYIKYDSVKEYGIWIITQTTADKTKPYADKIAMWQHSVAASNVDTAEVKAVPGVPGQCCVNYSYIDYADVIAKAGMNKFDIAAAKFKVGDKVALTRNALVHWNNNTASATLELLKVLGSDPYAKTYTITAVQSKADAEKFANANNTKDPYAATNNYPYTIQIQLGTTSCNVTVRQSDLTKK